MRKKFRSRIVNLFEIFHVDNLGLWGKKVRPVIQRSYDEYKNQEINHADNTRKENKKILVLSRSIHRQCCLLGVSSILLHCPHLLY